MLLNRRGLLVGLGGLIAAPAVVRAASLMPVRGLMIPIGPIFSFTYGEYGRIGLVEWLSFDEAQELFEPKKLVDVLYMNRPIAVLDYAASASS